MEPIRVPLHIQSSIKGYMEMPWHATHVCYEVCSIRTGKPNPTFSLSSYVHCLGHPNTGRSIKSLITQAHHVITVRRSPTLWQHVLSSHTIGRKYPSKYKYQLDTARQHHITEVHFSLSRLNPVPLGCTPHVRRRDTLHTHDRQHHIYHGDWWNANVIAHMEQLLQTEPCHCLRRS